MPHHIFLNESQYQLNLHGHSSFYLEWLTQSLHSDISCWLSLMILLDFHFQWAAMIVFSLLFDFFGFNYPSVYPIFISDFFMVTWKVLHLLWNRSKVLQMFQEESWDGHAEFYILIPWVCQYWIHQIALHPFKVYFDIM